MKREVALGWARDWLDGVVTQNGLNKFVEWAGLVIQGNYSYPLTVEWNLMLNEEPGRFSLLSQFTELKDDVLYLKAVQTYSRKQPFRYYLVAFDFTRIDNRSPSEVGPVVKPLTMYAELGWGKEKSLHGRYWERDSDPAVQQIAMWFGEGPCWIINSSYNPQGFAALNYARGV